MARLPSERYLMQRIGGTVVLFEEGTEREIAKFDPSDRASVEQARQAIRRSDLDVADKEDAHFWCGYFHAQSVAKSAVAESIMDHSPPADPPARRPRYVNLGVTDDQVADGKDFGRYDFPNLGNAGRKSAEERDW
jgi:hypothetical protein